MAKTETHENDCIRLLGKPYTKVHKWLDAYTKDYPIWTYLEYHRRFRHHTEGVEKVKEKWGFYHEQAAKIHIIRDNELYCLNKPMDEVQPEEIDELYEKALNYCHPAFEGK